MIEVNNDGECGWAAIGLGNSIASIKGHAYDATTRKNKHKLIREKKNSFGDTTRLKMYGYAEGRGKEKWKKTKEKDWKAHVTGDQTKEGGPPITTFEEYTEAIRERKKRWIDELLIRWAVETFAKDIIILGVAEEKKAGSRQTYYLRKWLQKKPEREEK